MISIRRPTGKSAVAAFALSLSLGTTGCGKDKFVYYSQPQNQNVTSQLKIKEIVGASGVDLLWIIDNSGSMSVIQQNVIANSALFMQDFIGNNLDWKLGLISTDDSDPPYLGFDSANKFDSTSYSPVATFQSKVASMGTSGSGTEKSFSPLLKQLGNYPGFTRPGVPLAVVIVTDAQEQSSFNFDQFLLKFKALIGPGKKFYVYAALNANDLGCNGEDGSAWNYKTDPYRSFVESADVGKVFPLCTPDFGHLLAQIGHEISQQITRSVFYLKHRPKPSTIRVTYKGTQLMGGPQESGGAWYYDYGYNAVIFYDLKFAADRSDSVSVDYKIDDGLPEKKNAVSVR